MEPSKKKSKSRGSGTELEAVAKTPACASSGISPEGMPADDEKEFQDVMAIVADLKREVEHSWSLREALQAERETLRASQQEAEALVAARSQEIERIQTNMSSLQSENEQLTAELASSKEERSEAVREINRLKDDLENKKQEIQGLEEKRSNLEKTFKVTKREADAKERDSLERIGQLKQDTGKLEERLKQKTQELSQEFAAIDDLKREKKQLEGEVAHLVKTRGNLKMIHDSLKSVQQMCSSPGSDPPQPQEDS